MPSLEILREQPRWTWFMTWGDPSSAWRQFSVFQEIYRADETLTLDELPWTKITQPEIHHPILR